MRICNIKIDNFRGIKHANIFLDGNSVFVGDNNAGKSTIFEAIDLVMGPDRLNRQSIIKEHDFYAGEYFIDEKPIEINIEVTLIDLSDEQKRHFFNNIEWWDLAEKIIIEGAPPSGTDDPNVVPAIRLTFKGWYDVDEDDFVAQTYYTSSLINGEIEEKFSKKDKRLCGFLYLRTLRTGNRALSLEHGSLLDIILQLKELKPQMWEDIISQLKNVSIASNPELGISDILTSVQETLSSIVTFECADKPQMKVSTLTRENLRKIVTVFLSSGAIDSNGDEYIIPYYYQGTGTVNTLVLALLSMIADEKSNVIFAMEEPEIAIPPHIQKRIVTAVIDKSTQALFTSHSPYVLEEFNADSIVVVSNDNGELKATPAGSPPHVKAYEYREQFRKRFCETMLARRVLIVEGRTEYDTYCSVSRQLQQLHPEKQLAFDLLGISVINAESDSKIAQLGEYYKKLNKTVYAIYDKQESEEQEESIELATDYRYELNEKGLEKAIINTVPKDALLRFGSYLIDEKIWPEHLASYKPTAEMCESEIKNAFFEFFTWKKSAGYIAMLLGSCNEEEIPEFIKEIIYNISETIIGSEVIETEA